MTLRIPELRVTTSRRSPALLATALVCIGCTASPAAPESQDPTSNPTVTASAIASASAEPTPLATLEPSITPVPTLAFEAPDDILPPASIVVVVVDTLQLRGEPGLSAAVVGTASAGEQFYVLGDAFGPVVADGLDWYRLTTAGDSVLWAAAGSGADRYLEVVPPDCPSADPDLAMLTTMIDWDRLACFGDRPLTVEGTYGCPPDGGCGGMTYGRFEPGWLASPYVTNPLWVEYPSSSVVELNFQPDSAITKPAAGSVVRVTGHLSDSASTSCRITTGDPREVDPRTAELYCRERFVVDAVEVLGTDPAYP